MVRLVGICTARITAKQETGVAPLFCFITANGPARLWPAFVMRHGPFLGGLVFANEKA